MDNKGLSFVRLLVVIALLGILLPGGYFLYTRMEGVAPEVILDPDPQAIGIDQELSLTVSDPGRGIRYIRVVLAAKGMEKTLFEETYDGSALMGTGYHQSVSVTVPLRPRELGLPDGEGTLRIEAADFAWRRWMNGNLADIKKPVTIDTLSPRVSVLTTSHYINQGGAGLVAFKVSESCPRIGVTVGDRFFPAHTGFFEDSEVFAAFFAVSYDQGTQTPVTITATDAAGNETAATFPYRIRKKQFRTDILNISDRFIETQLVGSFSPEGGQAVSNKDLFLYVNRDVRKANYDLLTEVGRRSEAVKRWDGVFLRLPNSAPKAGFADHRIYRYKDEEVDRQVHLGADLASIKHSPVPAANDGKVVFTDNVGIYGQTVIIDHGFGLLTSYSHLSEIQVSPGDSVGKGDTIGRTGATGLAAGDHLHFGVLIHDTFVNPVEWWDDGWLKDNIQLKIEQVAAR
ncbi:MAG: M23 family metallopeptidase [Desulfobacterales bacterium]